MSRETGTEERLARAYTGPELYDRCDDCRAHYPDYEVRGGIYCRECAIRQLTRTRVPVSKERTQ